MVFGIDIYGGSGITITGTLMNSCQVYVAIVDSAPEKGDASDALLYQDLFHPFNFDSLILILTEVTSRTPHNLHASTHVSPLA